MHQTPILLFYHFPYLQPSGSVRFGSTIYSFHNSVVSLFCPLFFVNRFFFLFWSLILSSKSPKAFGECVKCIVLHVMHLYLGNDFMCFAFKARTFFSRWFFQTFHEFFFFFFFSRSPNRIHCCLFHHFM